MLRWPGVIFDYDGTLMDSQEAIMGCMRYAFKRCDLPDPEDALLYRMIGQPLRQGFRCEVSDDEDLVERLFQAYREHWFNWGFEVGNLFPDTNGLLEKLSAEKAVLAIATAKSQVGIDRSVEQTGVIEFFEDGCICGVGSDAKDKTAVLKRALKTTGLSASKVVMIGDRCHDAAAAKENGCDFIGVRWGYAQSDEFIDYLDIPLVDDFAELEKLLII